jgi:hypothetical protein
MGFKKMIKNSALRAIRKSASIGSKVLEKSLTLSDRIQGKTSRMIDGTDFSIRRSGATPLEKIYYGSLPEVTPINPSLPAIGSKGCVVLFLPTLDGKSFYGGTATALVVAARVAEVKKLDIKIVQTLKTGRPEDLSTFFKHEGLDIPGEKIHVVSVADRRYNIYGYVSMHPDDVYIASAWWDAHLLSRLPLPSKFIYLVQDYEPIFYNNSDQYVLAEATYKLKNYIPLCNTKLMYDFMRDRGYEAFKKPSATYFEPAVSRIDSGPAIEKKKSEKKKLFLYGRPNVHRNLFLTALESIDYAVKAGFIVPDDWEFIMAGQDHIPAIQLTSGIKIENLGKIGLQEYIDFSKTVDLAVSPMMAPHPNYPTLEFSSIGTAVVTTKYGLKQDLSNYSKNIFISDIGVESMAGAIKLAAGKSYDSRMKDLKTTSIENDWSKSISVASIKDILASLE